MPDALGPGEAMLRRGFRCAQGTTAAAVREG